MSGQSPAAFLAALLARGVGVRADDGVLIFTPKWSLAPAELAAAKDLKPGLLALLEAEGVPPEPGPGGLVPLATPAWGPPLVDPDSMFTRWKIRTQGVARRQQMVADELERQGVLGAILRHEQHDRQLGAQSGAQ